MSSLIVIFLNYVITHVLWVLSAVQMILMSGLSRTALEDLSSDKLFEDRIPHICNILKFAVLKKDHSFMATGGPWDPIDGMDPSIDQSSLIQTMLRCGFFTCMFFFCHSLPPSVHCLRLQRTFALQTHKGEASS